MAETNKYGFLDGDRFIIYFSVPFSSIIYSLYTTGTYEFEFLKFVVVHAVPILLIEVLNQLSIRLDKWLERRKLLKKAR